MNTIKQLSLYFKAGYPFLQIATTEDGRIEADVKEAAESIQAVVYMWSFTTGLLLIDGENTKQFGDETKDPISALIAFLGDNKLDGKGKQVRSVIIMRTFNLVLENIKSDPNAMRQLKDAVLAAQQKRKTIVSVGANMCIPPELAKDITLVEYELPDRERLRSIAVSFNLKLAKEKQADDKTLDRIADSASGLTCNEATNAYALSIVEAGTLDPKVVQREKVGTVKKNGLLEIFDSPVSLDDIGGLDQLKSALSVRRKMFTKEAREYGIPKQRDILAVGDPGTGKSLCAKALQSVFQVPLLRLEAGRLFGGVVGESERNWRTAHATARAVRPCIVWIDEVDGLGGGNGGHGNLDGGTTDRVVKGILQDMQDNSEGILFFMTANDVDKLPDALIDRLDVWVVNLPTKKEREEIWKIQIKKYKRNPASYDIESLSELTEGFSGRQIEGLWVEALTVAFNEEREPENLDILGLVKTIVPTSKLMAESIARRRKRLANRARCASSDSSGEQVFVGVEGREL